MPSSHVRALPLVWLGIALTVVVGCGDDAQTAMTTSTDEPEPDPEGLAELDAARESWASEGQGDYTIYAKRDCFCALEPSDDVFVTVRDGELESALANSGDENYDEPVPRDEWHAWYTVAGMFDQIEDALSTAADVQASYDASYGFPRSVTVDYVLNAADDEISYEMRDYTPLSE